MGRNAVEGSVADVSGLFQALRTSQGQRGVASPGTPTMS